jgi:hypothetical protein
MTTLGQATVGGQTVAPTNDTLYATFSCTKGLMAVAAWLLVEDGLLDPARRVAELVPEFGTNGKDVVTIEQLYLTRVASRARPSRPLEWDDRARRLERFARWRLEWEPGSRFVYHPTSSMWVAAEVIERLSGLDYREFVHGASPSRSGCLSCASACQTPTCAHRRRRLLGRCAHTRGAGGGRMARRAAEGRRERGRHLGLNTPEIRRIGLPGGGAIGTAGDLALFYQALVRNPRHRGPSILRPETIARACVVRTSGLTDPLFGKPVNRAFGVVVAGDSDRASRGFGPTGSPACSATTAPAARSPGAIPTRGSRSRSARTASTATPSGRRRRTWRCRRARPRVW